MTYQKDCNYKICRTRPYSVVLRSVIVRPLFRAMIVIRKTQSDIVVKCLTQFRGSRENVKQIIQIQETLF